MTFIIKGVAVKSVRLYLLAICVFVTPRTKVITQGLDAGIFCVNIIRNVGNAGRKIKPITNVR